MFLSLPNVNLFNLPNVTDLVLGTSKWFSFQVDLMAACQSDKIAASRAMIQNKQLKDQLDELQYAIVQVVSC